MSTGIDRDTVLKVAKLSALEMTDSEVALTQERLNSLLSYINQLSEVDTSTIPEMIHTDRDDVFRQDEVVQVMTVDQVLSNAPEHGRQCFKIPKVL